MVGEARADNLYLTVTADVVALMGVRIWEWIFIFGLSLPVFAQELYFDRYKKICVEGPTKDTFNRIFSSILRPCFYGQLNNFNFQELQKFPTLQTLWLQGARSNYSGLYGQKIQNAYFSYSFLKQSKIMNSRFTNAYFQYADLRGTIIERSEFKNFSFEGANLNGIKVRRARFIGGDFLRAKFKDSVITDSYFEDCLYGPEFKKEAILINVTFKNCHEKTH